MITRAFFSLIVLATSLVNSQTYTTPPNLGGAVGCVVTGKLLFSHGNFIRELNADEMGQMTKYKADLAVFKKKIDEAFENAEKIEKSNSTVPPMPVKPSMPGFCVGPDTTLYIFGGCTIQNNKVYVGKALARELDASEKKKLSEFVAKIAKGDSKNTADYSKGLDFCTEF